MIKKVGLLVAGGALAVVMSVMISFNAPNIQLSNQASTGSIIQAAQAQSINNRKECFLRTGCKFKIDWICFGGGCGGEED